MDYAWCAHLSNFQLQLEEGRTNDFWMHSWYIVEQSIAAFTGAAGRDDVKDFLGRATKMVKKTTFKPTFRSEAKDTGSSTVPSQVHHIAVHANRCKHLATCLHVQAKAQGNASARRLLIDDIEKHTALACKFARWELHNPHAITMGLDSSFGGSCAADLLDTLSSSTASPLKRIMLLEKAAKRYLDIHSAHLAKLRGLAIAANNTKRTNQ